MKTGACEVRKEVFILTPEPPEILGGLETFIREQIHGLEEHGYAVRIFHRKNSAPHSFLQYAQKICPPIADAFRGFFIGRAAQQSMHEEVAAVISHSTVGWYPLRVPPSCKQVHFYHGTYRAYAEVIRPRISLGGYWKMKWWDSMVLERLSGRGKRVLSNSGQVAEEVLRFFGYESHVVSLIASRQSPPLDQGTCRRSFDLPADACVGVFVGSLHPMKNFGVVRALIRALPDVYWVLAIRGELPEDSFRTSRVRLIQDAPPELLPAIYSSGDFSLCPSVYEPFGYVVAEALACGVPVIASPGGASSLFLSEPPLDVLLVPRAEDTEAFLEIIREVLARPLFYRQLVLEHARPRVERWMSPENWWPRFFDVTGLSDFSPEVENARTKLATTGARG